VPPRPTSMQPKGPRVILLARGLGLQTGLQTRANDDASRQADRPSQNILGAYHGTYRQQGRFTGSSQVKR